MNKNILYLLMIIGLLVFAFVCKKELPESNHTAIDQNLKIDWQNRYTGSANLPTRETVRQAVLYAREQHQLVEQVIIDSSFNSAGVDAVDVVNGQTFFTRVALSEKGDTVVVQLFPVAFKSTKGPEATLSTVLLNFFADYNAKKIGQARRHG